MELGLTFGNEDVLGMMPCLELSWHSFVYPVKRSHRNTSIQSRRSSIRKHWDLEEFQNFLLFLLYKQGITSADQEILRRLLLSLLLDISQMNFGKLEYHLRMNYYCRRGNLPLCYVYANDQFLPIDLVLNLEVAVNEEFLEYSLLSPEVRRQSGHLLLSLQ